MVASKPGGTQIGGGCRNWMHTSSFVQTKALGKMEERLVGYVQTIALSNLKSIYIYIEKKYLS